MKKGLNIFDSYDFTDCREIVGNELYKINGGKQVENSNEGVAQAHTNSGKNTAQTTPELVNTNPTNSIDNPSVKSVVSKAGGAGLYINPKNEALHSLSNIMIKQNNIVARVVGIALLTSNIDDFGAYCGIEGAYLSYGGSAHLEGHARIGVTGISSFKNKCYE